MSEIIMDFKQDWVNMIESEINREGLVIPDNLQTDSKIIKYFAYLRKKAPRGPLNVIKSKNFTCKPKYLPAINELENIFKSGADFSPYLSKQVDQFKDDLMFNDWGVLHLHLGTELEGNGRYIKRTGPLLFVYFANDNVYFINVFPHKKWTNREVLQNLYDNWPELIEPYILPNVTGLSYEYTEEQHYRLRKSGMNALIPLNKKDGEKFVIVAPGLGITASGDSLTDVRRFRDISNELRKLEIEIREKLDTLKAALNNKDIPIPTQFCFEFQEYNEHDGWIIKEKNSNLFLDFL